MYTAFLLGNIKQVLLFPATLYSINTSQLLVKAMNKFNQIQKKPGRKIKRHELIAGAAIFLFVLLHFVSPFIFVSNENPSNEITSLQTEKFEKIEKIEDKRSAPVETEYKAEYKIENKAEVKPESAKTIKPPAPVTQKVAAQPKIAPRPAIKKKEPPRESRAERLRRAEKILTGV